MKQIIEWLKGIEKKAEDVYRLATKRFADYPELAKQFERLAEDEESHEKYMEEAAEVASRFRVDPAIEFDHWTRMSINSDLRVLKDILSKQDLPARDFVRYLIKTEKSEWNAIFLYVIDLCKQKSIKFQEIAASVQAHEGRIDRLLKNLPHELLPENERFDLPRVWEHRILVVDDDPAVNGFLVKILEPLGEASAASNGMEALEILQDRYFDVIMTDLDMPIMDGLEFFQQARATNQRIAQNFIFFTGNLSAQLGDFCRVNNIPLMRKPLRVSEIRDTVKSVMENIA